MILITKELHRRSVDRGVCYSRVALLVSTEAELPALGTIVSGTSILEGSKARCIQTGRKFYLDDTGTWYPTKPEQGGEPSA